MNEVQNTDQSFQLNCEQKEISLLLLMSFKSAFNYSQIFGNLFFMSISIAITELFLKKEVCQKLLGTSTS